MHHLLIEGADADAPTLFTGRWLANGNVAAGSAEGALEIVFSEN